VNTTILQKLDTLSERFEEIAGLLSEPSVQNDQNQFRSLSQEYAQLEPIVNTHQNYLSTLEDHEAAKTMLGDSDPEIKAMAKEELKETQIALETQEKELQILLLPKDPNDGKMPFLRFAQEPVAMKPLFSRVTYIACIYGLQRKKAGSSKS
jgi:Protein chain release factor A